MPTTAHGLGPSLQAGFLQLSPCQEHPAPLRQVVLASLGSDEVASGIPCHVMARGLSSP